jgi:hypothetical protein
MLDRVIPATAFGLAMLAAATAWAGELKFGTKQLEVDDQGKLTGAGRNAAVTRVENIAGEDEWQVFLWAKLDKPAQGPLYVEFWDKYQGKPIKLAWRHEEPDFQGDPYYSTEMTLPGSSGFNRDHTYTVQVTQVSEKGKDLTLAKGTLTLVKGAADSGKGDGKGKDGDEKGDAKKGGAGEDGGEENDQAEQDAFDSFAGGGAAEAGDGGGPPPVEEPGKKRGCAVDGGLGGPGLLLLFVTGAAAGRRRRRSA